MGDRFYLQRDGKIKPQGGNNPSGGLRLVRQTNPQLPKATRELKADIVADIQLKLNIEIPSLGNMTKAGLILLRSRIHEA